MIELIHELFLKKDVGKGKNADNQHFFLFSFFFWGGGVLVYFFLQVYKTRRSIVNPVPNKPWFLRVCSTSLLKTLREKEKLLVTSNFSFSKSVFYHFGELSFTFI